jgi:hypothetical protein
MTATTTMTALPFGKYRGVPLADVPDNYLTWLARQKLTGRLRDAVAAELGRRGLGPPPAPDQPPEPACPNCGFAPSVAPFVELAEPEGADHARA